MHINKQALAQIRLNETTIKLTLLDTKILFLIIDMLL